MAWQAPATSAEFDLTEQLRHRLGRAEAPRWRLTYIYETELVRFGGSEANRGRIHGTLSYELTATDGADSFAGSIKTFAGFTIAETTPTDTAPIVSNRVARRDAERRLATQIADGLISELMVKLGTPA